MSYSVHFTSHVLNKLQTINPDIVGISIPLDDEPSVSHVMWADDTEPDLTEEQLAQAIAYAEAMDYKERRINDYPSVVDQLDMLYHMGYEGWKEQITDIKTKYPKPDDV